MAQNFLRLYSNSANPDAAYFLNEGQVFFYSSNDDKYVIHGKNLIVGCTEIIMKHFANTQTGRIETAITDNNSKIKKITLEKFLSGMNTFSFIFNVSMVLAKQVKLTNEIIEKSMEHLEGDDRKVKKFATEYFIIMQKLKNEYDKRKLPWLKELIKKYETNLTFKKGEAFYKTSEANKVIEQEERTKMDTEFERGAVICEQGSYSKEMYVLRSGAIDVFVHDNKVASITDPGTIIGEMALLLGEERTATLIAKNHVVLSIVKKEDLKEIATKEFGILTGVALALAKRHYSNILKISNINRSIIEKQLEEEEHGKKVPQSQKVLSDLRALRSEIEVLAKSKDADYLKDIVY